MNLNTILEEINHLKIMLEYNDSNSFELTTKTKQAKKTEMQSKVKEINNKLIKFNNKLEHILKDINQNFDFNFFINNLKSTSTFDEINPRIEYEKAQEILKYVEEKKEKDRLENERINKENEKYRKEQLRKSEEANNKFLNTMGREMFLKMKSNNSSNLAVLISLLKRGLKLDRNDIIDLKNLKFFDSQDLLKVLYNSEQIDNKIVNEILKENE
jgi:hypothetical protein